MNKAGIFARRRSTTSEVLVLAQCSATAVGLAMTVAILRSAAQEVTLGGAMEMVAVLAPLVLRPCAYSRSLAKVISVAHSNCTQGLRGLGLVSLDSSLIVLVLIVLVT